MTDSNVTIALTQEGSFALIKPRGFLANGFSAFRAAIEGARYDGARRMNVASLDKVPSILKRLREAGFDTELSAELAENLKQFTRSMWLDLQGAKERVEAIDAGLREKGMSLYGFQRSGVQWLSTRHGALLADEMGLGKTIQVIAALPPSAPVLIVAPAVAKGVWRRELAKWRPLLKVVVLEGRNSFRWPEPGEAIILNYDILMRGHRTTEKLVKGTKRQARTCDKLCTGCAPYLAECPPNVSLVADEAHNLKNGKAARTESFRAMSETVRQKAGRVWLVTATPLLNRPQELWSIYQAAGIAQEAFGSWKQFQVLFDGTPAYWGGFEWGTPLAEVGERIRRVSLRRHKAEVLADLPAKTHRTVTVDVDRETLRKCDDILAELGGIDQVLELIEKEGLKFETMSAIKRALAVAKIPAAIAMVEDFEEQDEPLVVFSAHRALVETLGKRKGWATIMGGVSAEDRTRIEDRFQAGELKGVACTIQAGGVAITLTRATNAIFSDRDWTPALNSQAEDRIHRIGQSRGVVITTLVAEHELDQRITELLLRKQELIAMSVDEARTIEHHGPDSIDAEYEAMVRAAFDEVADAAVTPGPQDKPSRFRKPETAAERWVVEALDHLAANDEDFAQTENGRGFNKLDASVGHSLQEAWQKHGGLTPAQYKLAIKVCTKYHGQVGKCPGEVAA